MIIKHFINVLDELFLFINSSHIFPAEIFLYLSLRTTYLSAPKILYVYSLSLIEATLIVFTILFINVHSFREQPTDAIMCSVQLVVYC